MDQQFYQSSRFAEMGAVTVRTLRYYDKMGLLSPAQHTESGYRLYTNEDLLNLQNILALKFLGFSLDEIRALLRLGPERLEEVLARQKAMMQEKRDQLDSIIQAIEETERLLQANQCDWESIVKVIQVIQTGQKNDDWVNKYFTPEQRKSMDEISKRITTDEVSQKLKTHYTGEWTEADQQSVNEQYKFVKKELGRLVAQGADPTSPEAQNIARIRHELCFGFTRGDPVLIEHTGKWWEEFQKLPDDQKPDMSVYTYSSEEQALLDKALAIFKERQQ